MDNQAGSKDANREHEVGHGIKVNDVDDNRFSVINGDDSRLR